MSDGLAERLATEVRAARAELPAEQADVLPILLAQPLRIRPRLLLSAVAVVLIATSLYGIASA